MASNGPYSVEAFGKSGYFVKGPFAHGAIVSVVDYVMATEMALICNMAHAEGIKSEREQCVKILRDYDERIGGILLRDCLDTLIELLRGGQDAK